MYYRNFPKIDSGGFSFLDEDAKVIKSGCRETGLSPDDERWHILLIKEECFFYLKVGKEDDACR